MNKYIPLYIIGIVLLITSWSIDNKRPLDITEDMPVSGLLQSLGVDLSDKMPDYNVKGVSIEAGKTLFESGFATKTNGKKGKRQSKHFVCTSCHNTVKEDPDLRVSDPAARLTFAEEHNLPFLQGTTMYGAVSRETYYNGDYFKKYGDLVEPARNDIRGAINLCAVECAQGRSLKEWELESILAYLWDIDIKVADLQLTDNELAQLNDGTINDDTKVALIKSKYLLGSPATFIPPPVDRKTGTGLDGDVANGKVIYERSCLHCHYQGQYSFLHLDHSALSLKYLKKKAPTYHNHSLYQVTRWGVPSKSGKESYMPQYPKEKLSDQQLTDLMAYIAHGPLK